MHPPIFKGSFHHFKLIIMRHLSILLIVAAIMGSGTLYACDICGSHGSSSSFGFLPMVSRHFIGLRGQFQEFATQPHGSGYPSTDVFRTLDLWGRWQVHPRVQLLASVPFHFNDRTFENGTHFTTQGLGDVSLLMQWSLFKPAAQANRHWQHTLLLGGGVKLPTGPFHLEDSEGALLVIHLQPGTGSTDGILTGFYALRRGKIGASIDATYTRTGSNADDYQMGNRWSSNFRFFMVEKRGNTRFLPHIGLLQEIAKTDHDKGKNLGESGGKSLFAGGGLDVFMGNFIVGVNAQIPLTHELARGYVTPKTRFNVSATLLFGGKKKAEKPVVPTILPR